MSSIGIAIIGASARSKAVLGHVKKHPEDGFVTGVYDVVPAKSQHQVAEQGLSQAKVYASQEELLADPKVQAVFVMSTDCAHAAGAVPALLAGKHVFCEKPLATRMEDVDAIIAAAGNAKGIFYLGMNLRHNPMHAELYKVVASGALGKLMTIEANEYYVDGRTYFRRWNRLRKFGGGLWITKASHDFDLLNWFSGGRPKRVYATSSLSYYKPKAGAGVNCRTCGITAQCPDWTSIDPVKSPNQTKQLLVNEQSLGHPWDLCVYNSDKDTFDNGMAVVEYDNDVRATFTLNVVAGRDTRQLRVMGTAGSAEGDSHDGTIKVWKRYNKDKTPAEIIDVKAKMVGGHGGADNNIFSHFFHCCRTGESPRTGWADGRASLAVGLAATKSCDTRQPVELE